MVPIYRLNEGEKNEVTPFVERAFLSAQKSIGIAIVKPILSNTKAKT